MISLKPSPRSETNLPTVFILRILLSALADPTRRDIAMMLASNDQLSSTEIYENFHVSHQATSQHLKILREANLVYVEKDAQKRIYRLNTKAMVELEEWYTNISLRWSRRLDALDAVLKAEMKKASKNQVEKDEFNGSKYE